MNYVSAKEAKTILQISAPTLMKWKNNGKISFKKLSDKKILYDIDSISNESCQSFNTKNVIF